MILGCLQEELERNLRIVVVAHVHRELQAYALIRIAPVDERARDQVLVRNQGVDAVAVPHHHVAAAQLLHPAEITGARAGACGEADDVAGLDGLVHQQHEAADEVARDRLQTEAQPQANGAGEYVERGHINAGGVDPQQHAQPQQQEVGELRDADPGRHGQLVEPHDVTLDRARDQARHDQEGRDYHEALEQAPQAQLRSSRNQADAVEGGLEHIQPAEQRHRRDHPQHERDAVFPGANPGIRAEQQAEHVNAQAQEHQRAHDLQRAVDDCGGRRERGQRCVPGKQCGERRHQRRQDQRALQCVVQPVWRVLRRGATCPPHAQHPGNQERDHARDQQREHRAQHLR